MIEYRYRCESCTYEFDRSQRITEKSLSQCPKCKNESLERIMFGGIHVIVTGEPTTLGQLAERNTKKMGKEQIQRKRSEHKKAERAARREMSKNIGTKLGGKGVPLPDERPTPFYGKADHAKINKMTPEQQVKYIMEGK